MPMWVLLVVFAVATAAGYKVISDVPSLLHTPLMSGLNALSGITISGALVATAMAVHTGNRMLGIAAIVMAMINVTGGFLVTHRMLRMFKKKERR